MRPDTCPGDEIVELYFYDELTPAERARADAHFAACSACRESLADLRAIAAAIASRSVDAPGRGWAGFMTRLDTRIETERRAAGGSAWFALAAALALVATGVFAGWTLSRSAASPPEPASVAARPPIDRAIAAAGGSGLDRARVVLAGLAHKEEGAEWSLERRMAATLLPEVSLIRQVAADRGRGDLADILTDVEALLLQASYADTDDAETLARLRGMIDRRDLLTRLSVAAGAAAPPRRRPESRPGI